MSVQQRREQARREAEGAALLTVCRDEVASRIVLVGHHLKDPFAGPPGTLLRECLREAGLDADVLPRVTITDDSALPMLPTGSIAVALGNEAMRALTKRSGITEKRGEEVVSDTLHLTVLPTFHPGYVLRRASARSTLVKDLVRARRIAAGEPLEDPAEGVRFIDGPPLLSPADEGRTWAVDVETDENDEPRLFALGSGVDNITVHPATTRQLQDWSRPDVTWLGHNLRADQLWLRRIGVELGPKREDTMLMAHLLNENRRVGLKKLALELLDPKLYWKYVEPNLKHPTKRGAIDYEELGRYCANDVAATLLIHGVLSKQLAREPRLETLYRKMSLPLSDVLLEAESRGVLFDRAAAEEMVGEYRQELTRVGQQLDSLVGAAGTNWGSHPQVRACLYDRLGLPVPHMTKGDKPLPSTDEKALMHLRTKHPLVPVLLRWRELDKQRQMIEAWLRRQKPSGRVYPTYNQTGTVTGRLSGRDPNPQNIPLEKFEVNGRWRSIRELIIAPDDYLLLSADYKTLEIGVAAWQYDDKALRAAYLTGDPHTVTATRLLGRAPADKVERKKFGKTPNFGLLYQQGDIGFMEYAAKSGLEMTLDEASYVRAMWHQLYPGVRAGWKRIGHLMQANGGVLETASGRKRRLPEFLSGSRALVNEAWRQGCNTMVQTPAAEFTHIAAIIAAPALAELYGAYLILHVHDSLTFEVPKAHIALAAGFLKRVMEEEVPKYFEQHFGTPVGIPLFAEVEAGPNWGTLAPIDL